MTDEQVPPEDQTPEDQASEEQAHEDTPASEEAAAEEVAATAPVVVEDEPLHVDKYERNWLVVSGVTLVVFFIAVTVAGFALGIQVPTNEARVDPNTLGETPPWSEPGVREVVPGEEYDVYMVARRYQFSPREIAVPEGAKVNFYVTSGDVQHGMTMFSEQANVNINFMIIPGQVSAQSATFDTPGTYTYICHEYCGAGHAIMWGQLTVEPKGGE